MWELTYHPSAPVLDINPALQFHLTLSFLVRAFSYCNFLALPVITQTEATPVNSRSQSRCASLRQSGAQHTIEVTQNFAKTVVESGTPANGDSSSNKADLLIVSNQNDHVVSSQPSPIRNLLSPQPSLVIF